MYRHLLIILSIIVCGNIQAQALIGGTVKDAESLEPIQYVSIRLDNSLKGTSTDAEGRFTIEILNYESTNSFTIQLVGYQTKKLGLVELMKNDEIFLTVDEQEIDEVIVQPKNAFEIVQAAIKKIPDNYYANPVGQEVFYRQSLVTNGELSILEEGKYHLLNTFHRKKLPRNVVMKKARAFIDMSAYEELGKIVAKNLLEDSVYVSQTAEILLAFNPDLTDLQEDKQGIFGSNAFKNYNYNYVGMAIKGGLVLYIISFDQKEDVKKTLYQGEMYIDTASMAITEIQASLSPQGIDLQKFMPLKFRLLAKLAGFKINIEDISFNAQYKEQDGFWVVANAGFDLKGQVSRRKGEVLNGTLHLDYRVLNNFPKTEFYNLPSPYNVLPSSIQEFQDQSFWQGVNYLNVDVKVEEALNKKLTAQ
ncbi:MAG: hypothetical protein ACI9O4_000930 [Chitinophagales bacterium]|jgi:hypothetical protein